jgi:gallate 1-beta-glucosyltransferase
MSQESPSPVLSSPPTPHVLLVSLPLQGHVNPLLVLGQCLASRGLLVTFTTVPHAGLKKLEHEDGLPVGFRVEHLTGAGLWAPDDPRFCVPDDMARHMDAAAPAALAGLIWRQAAPVSCVVANAFAPWALRAAGAAGVPGSMLWTQSCAVLSLHYHYFHSLAAFPARETAARAPVDVPGLPRLVSADLSSQIHAPEEYVWRRMLVADMTSLRETASWVLVNTFDELEHVVIAALPAHVPVLPVGPLFEADNEDVHDDECTEWLDSQPPRSVVYVAFGSLVQHGREEMAELAAGLASTGRPFLWVVRDDIRHLLPDHALIPSTVGDSSRGMGKVVPWFRQRRVLSHHAVGCFVAHCGWNSTTEAIAAGVPIVAYPAWSDQPTNSKLLVDVYDVGVRLPAPLSRDGLRRCVEEVMLRPGAEGVWARAWEWKSKARKAVAAGGSSDRGVKDFVDAIIIRKLISPNGMTFITRSDLGHLSFL